MSRRDSAASRSSSSRSGARTRSDGKIDVQCPQCAAQYRLPADKLDAKIECSECHRVFFAKTTAGKRVQAPDNTKVYVGFGIAAVGIIGIFILSSGGSKTPDKPATPPPAKVAAVSLGDNPRTSQLVKWARAVGDNSQLILQTHSDLAAIGKELGLAATDNDSVIKELQTHDATRYLRELVCDSATLVSEADLTGSDGRARIFVSPKPGDDNYKKNTRGEIDATFRMDGEQVKVTGWKVTLPPVRNPNKPDPSKQTFVPNKNIERAKEVTITDSAGTRKVQESKPGPLPHWEKATPEQQKMADEVVAQVLKSAEPDAPGNLLARATLRPQTDDDRRAVVPRLLNAMYECYSDVNANNMKLSQLNRAVVAIVGFGVNYQVADTGDPANDKKERESSVRQWFAFWYRYSNDFSKWRESEESLDKPTTDPKADPKAPAKK